MNIRELFETTDGYKIHKVERDDYVSPSKFLERVRVSYQTLESLFGEPVVDEDENSDIAVLWGLSIYYTERGSESEKYNEPEKIDIMFSLKKYESSDSDYDSYVRQNEWMLHGSDNNQWDAKMLASKILSNKIAAK